VDEAAVGPDSSLWGEELPEKKPKKKDRRRTPAKQPHVQRLIDHWFKHYEEQYGQKPPFTQRDAHHIKSALKACRDDPTRVENALTSYLACREPFFRGHPLSQFIGQLGRWTAGREGRASSGSAHGLDESIDTHIL
ncbi:hypothetical protein R0J87_18340, partial [Halomonas sp. SIMBA_159]